MRDSSQIRHIVNLAVKETRAIRIVLSGFGALLGLLGSKWAIRYFFSDFFSDTAQTAATAIFVFVAAYLTAVASEVLVHRKIEYFANDT